MQAGSRETLAPLQGKQVFFTGRYQFRDPEGNLFLKPVQVEGRRTDHAWLNAKHGEVLTAPVGSRISGQAFVFKYKRQDGTKDWGLTGSFDLEVTI